MRLIYILSVAHRKPLEPRGLVDATAKDLSLKLSDVATIKVGLKDADFWIIRRGSRLQVGRPVRGYNPEHIGVKVNRTDILLPDYLYYALMRQHFIGAWKEKANGTLNLVNIKVSDVQNIVLIPT